jgi:hypothetical protein
VLFERRDCRAYRLNQALLLGNVKVGCGARVELLPDQVEDALGGRQIIARDP